jgi:hypothetical protein
MDINNKCNLCNKIFKSRQSKCNHIKKFHKNINIDNQIINKENKCIYCNKTFTTKSTLTRHHKEYCKIKNNFIDKITNENNQQVNIIINNNNNIMNNTVNNTLNINPYNNPNMNNFELLDICNIFDQEFNMILKLIEVTYFNEKFEENHCFNVTNLQGEYVNTNETTKLKKYFFDELFGVILDRVKLLYKKYKNKLFELPKQLEIQEKIQALEDMRNDNSNNYKSYLKLINILAYDKKDIVINTWEKLKQLKSLDKNDEIIWDRNIDVIV